jgi:hypothetical protein
MIGLRTSIGGASLRASKITASTSAASGVLAFILAGDAR